jgi:hypothetical protein
VQKIKKAYFWNMMKKTALFLLLFTYTHLAYAQGEDDTYTRAFTYGINFNTNGGTIGGGNIKFSQISKKRLYRTLGLEVVAIKHPQEQRVRSLGGSANTYIYAKNNYLYSVRPTYGFDYLLFKKAPEESVQVLATFAAGPSIGVEVPYYVLWAPNNQTVVATPHKPLEMTQNQIQGTAGIFKGITEAKIIPALFTKAGISLEFGEFRNNITGIEVGFTSELFFRAPNILEPRVTSTNTTIKNKQFMLGAYLTVFLGSRK